MMSYDNLGNFFKTNFNMMHFHKYSLSDIENMMPWERHLYLELLKEQVKQENDRIKEQQQLQRRQQARAKGY